MTVNSYFSISFYTPHSLLLFVSHSLYYFLFLSQKSTSNAMCHHNPNHWHPLRHAKAFSLSLSRFLSHFPQPRPNHEQLQATIHNQPPPFTIQESRPHIEAQRLYLLAWALLISLIPLCFSPF
ncbi:hypothetical protein I3843_11G040400 [Carya illinoinensis]|nr:hypothetical protein I3843_11G040400 [Carya illinoinensis]